MSKHWFLPSNQTPIEKKIETVFQLSHVQTPSANIHTDSKSNNLIYHEKKSLFALKVVQKTACSINLNNPITFGLKLV